MVHYRSLALSLTCLVSALAIHSSDSFAMHTPTKLAQSRAFTTATTSSSSSLGSSRYLEGLESFDKDTDLELPTFVSRDDYFGYLAERSGLPQGFQTGVASGHFQSVEAPGLGFLPIRATVVYLPDGPTESWAACFTSNRVGVFQNIYLMSVSTCIYIYLYIFIYLFIHSMLCFPSFTWIL